jgi:hypothetical protein
MGGKGGDQANSSFTPNILCPIDIGVKINVET